MNNIASPAKPRVALIAGPTASGKSALATRLAEIAGGTVINADASQVYADLRILSARPDDADLARAPHRLFGYRDAAGACSAADWAQDARSAIAESRDAGRLPILVGGTGLYLRTLLQGIAPIPEIDPAVRAAVRALPVDVAHAALAIEDPHAGARLNPNDAHRIARALEVVRSSGEPLHVWQQQLSGGIDDIVSIVPIILLPPREALRARCDARFDAMIATGGVGEVEAMLARRLDRGLPAMRAIGVPEIIDWCEGRIDHAMMAARAKASTRQYAKRQYTWFRHQPPGSWQRLEAQLDDDLIEKIAIKLHKQALTA